MNASDWKAWANLGLACEWLNRKSEADQAYRNELTRVEELSKIRADDPELHAELGLLYSKSRQGEKALPELEAALTRGPDDPNILSTSAEAYENLGDRTLALELANKALARGWPLEQLQSVASLRELLLDSRFRKNHRTISKKSNLPNGSPDGQSPLRRKHEHRNDGKTY
jgi:tetratricopeptide (TPR) repeat protein